MATQKITPYQLVEKPIGYQNKKEITAQDPRVLVKGSKNVIINDADKVSGRLGFVLDGQANTVKKGIDRSYDFISRQGTIVLRSHQGEVKGTGKLQVRTEYTPGNPLYYDLLENLSYTNFSFTTWWNSTEVTRVLVFVDGTSNIRMWSGGIGYVKSNTPNSITLYGSLITASTISFVAGGSKILDSANGFVTAGFAVGDIIEITGTTLNNGLFKIKTVTAGEIVVDNSNVIKTEAAGSSFTIKTEGTKTWAELGFFVSLSGRAIKIPSNTASYTYTGGHASLTLTGLSGVPTITPGTPVFQDVVTTTTLNGVSPMITPNIVWTKDNQVIYGDIGTSVSYGSKNTDYKDCAFTTPSRKPGEGFKITLDSNTVGFTQEGSSLYIFAGKDERYEVKFILSGDGTTESITFDKKIAAGQAAISQSGIFNVKNGIMYFTNEKTLTWLTSIENVFTPQALPISDPIKDDFDSFDLTNVSGIFYGNAIWITIPSENLVYIYDFDKALWQSPMTIPVSRFSIIDNVLYGHSNNLAESYRLNTGNKDNGVIIDYVAAFAPRTFGERFSLKQFDEYFNEVYLSASTVLKATHYFELRGASDIVEKEIDGADTGLMFAPQDDASLGKQNLGKNPLGSSIAEITTLNKYRCIHDIKKSDFFEHQVIYSTDSPDAQFEILTHGPNVEISTNLPKWIHR